MSVYKWPSSLGKFVLGNQFNYLLCTKVYIPIGNIKMEKKPLWISISNDWLNNCDWNCLNHTDDYHCEHKMKMQLFEFSVAFLKREFSYFLTFSSNVSRITERFDFQWNWYSCLSFKWHMWTKILNAAQQFSICFFLALIEMKCLECN